MAPVARSALRFWEMRLKRPVVKARRVTGEAYGPMINFIVAVAAPLKGLRAPVNLGGSMTTEMAYHAFRAYQVMRRNEVSGQVDVRGILESYGETPSPPAPISRH